MLSFIGGNRITESGKHRQLNITPDTYGKMMAWIALERAAALRPVASRELKKISAQIREDILQHGIAGKGTHEFLAESYDSNGIGTSSLSVPCSQSQRASPLDQLESVLRRTIE